MENILLTGVAGFIGWKTAEFLLKEGINVIGIDNMNDYYDVRLKEYRINQLKDFKNFKFYKADIENLEAMDIIFQDNKIDAVINLAARAGVRYSIENPFVYLSTNAEGTLNLLELSRKYGINKFVLASTSSLYAGQPMPFKEDLPVNTPISPYAASKKAAEVLCYTYHYLYGIDVSVVRYFTVYGPAGRPDMSIFRFIKWIDEEKPIELFGDGSQSRDFTYVDDIARGTIKALKPVGYEIINLGGGKNPISLKEVISTIEKYLGKKAVISQKEFHKADLKETWADITKAEKLLGWKPEIPFEEGIKRTIEWYLQNRDWLKDIKL
ncbi:NAD-dependent epimerase [Venenivibrio stagnispumantis]|uniref:Nucleoside-diphosphate-sugar epimerase n=1 Tax=Venenivibrio stagnispumantis TaxID=407998 RepID=A0AA46ACM6_9AQUI|nr:GDP-mannose 4,6-dehydratase [Venenivibrio stagnispumantis]MCW4572777.1 GDP-mannose 4,6-dehydratase [Venenivibrio stagnispumantis]SMP00335.1 Nucleoside-diphosphate-sugar epimerase [Venenivibrio stagnispumantis]